MQGHIRLFRQMLEWEWYKDVNTFKLFMHCLLRANYEAQKWQGKIINAGQFVTSIQHLSAESGLSIKQTRIALKKLEFTGEIGKQSTSQYSIITIKNWDRWQIEGKRRASEGQAKGKQRATIEEREESKEERKENKKRKESENTSSFELFWNEYPRKVAKQKAYSSYLAALKKASHDEIMRGLGKYVNFVNKTQKDIEFIAHASTWLNQQRWNDEYNTTSTENNVLRLQKYIESRC